MKNLIAFEKNISILNNNISYVLLQNTYKILFFSKHVRGVKIFKIYRRVYNFCVSRFAIIRNHYDGANITSLEKLIFALRKMCKRFVILSVIQCMHIRSKDLKRRYYK